MPDIVLDKPWSGFLAELDQLLEREVSLVCFGGFVTTVVYGCTRLTADIDCLEIVPREEAAGVLHLAGLGSPLHTKHGVYIELVGISNLPDSYNDRLTPMCEGRFRHLRLNAVDPYDLALSKLERNREVDQADVAHLVRNIPLRADVLRRRYEEAMRPYLGRPERDDLTLELWLEEFF